MKHVTIKRTGRIATVAFDTGTRANAFSITLMRELTEAARSFEDDHQTSAVILTGRSDTFSMGFDLEDAGRVAALSLAERRVALEAGPRMCAAWAGIRALTISAIEGWCIGGGMALAAATDLRVAGKGAQIYLPEVERGLNMSWGSVPRITALVGPARAKRLIVLAEKIDAETAAHWGLIDRIMPDGSAAAGAMEWAERAAAMPPVALRMCKQGIDAYATALGAATAAMDLDQFALAQSSSDAAEGIAAFFEKRSPKFTGD